MAQLSIGIAGAGVMGRLLGWQLLNAGYRVSVFDKDPIEKGTAAAFTAAGMLTPYAETESAELPIYHLGMQSLSLWPQIVQSLPVNVGFAAKGSLVVAHSGDAAELKRFNQQLDFKLDMEKGSGVNSPLPQHLASEGIQALEPELASQFQQATYLPNEAWVCPEELLQGLARGMLDGGVQWHAEARVSQVEPHCITADGKTFEFDWVIDCRGLGAKPEMPELRGVRGEVIWLQAPEVKISRLVRLMHPRYRLYLVPKYQDDIYIIGATQIESDDMGPITVRSTLELLSAVYSIHPGFAEARVLDTRTNCRPALSDNLPRIEMQQGKLSVNGLFRHGFLMAPALAQQVEFLLADPDYQSPFENLVQRQSEVGETIND